MHFNWEKLKRSLDMKMSELDSLSSGSSKKQTKLSSPKKSSTKIKSKK